MSESQTSNPKSQIFLGVDGGQSHTEAIIADETGAVLGRGFGGASNHAEQPGGKERLQNAITNSVGEALKKANLPPVSETVFAAAHCGMTGGADYKEEIIAGILKTEKLIVGHDAPTALSGATAGQPGIVVIAGTGAAIYGEDQTGATARAGGLGFLFSDEGSGFWLATQTVRLAIKEQDGLIAPDNLEKLVLDFFGRAALRDITTDFYNAKLTRDALAKLAERASEAAAQGNQTLRAQLKYGAEVLAASAASVARRLKFEENYPVAGVGGMFRASLVREFFAESLRAQLPGAVYALARFGPAVGALLLAYRRANVRVSEQMLANLEDAEKR